MKIKDIKKEKRSQKYCFVILKLCLMASQGSLPYRIRKNSANVNLTATQIPGIINKTKPTTLRNILNTVRIKKGHHSFREDAIRLMFLECSLFALFAMKSIRAAV